MAVDRKYPPQEMLARLKNWCDRQERCHQEVREKCYSWGYYYDDSEQYISSLIEDNYLNEERFARAYVSGKLRIKKWGRRKIVQHLKQKQISEYCIKKGLEEIDFDEYDEILRYWIERKKHQWKSMKSYERNGKVAHFCIQKGFESNLVWDILKESS